MATRQPGKSKTPPTATDGEVGSADKPSEPKRPTSVLLTDADIADTEVPGDILGSSMGNHGAVLILTHPSAMLVASEPGMKPTVTLVSRLSQDASNEPDGDDDVYLKFTFYTAEKKDAIGRGAILQAFASHAAPINLESISPVSYRKKVGQPPKFRNQGSGPHSPARWKTSVC